MLQVEKASHWPTSVVVDASTTYVVLNSDRLRVPLGTLGMGSGWVDVFLCILQACA